VFDVLDNKNMWDEVPTINKKEAKKYLKTEEKRNTVRKMVILYPGII
jgi:hypothetical protein